MAQPTIAAGNDNGNDLQSEDSEHPTFAYLLGSDSTTTSPESLSRDEYHEMRAMPPVIFPRRPGPRRLHYFRESDILDIYFRKAMLLAKLAADTMESIYASGCLWMDPTLMYGIGIALEVETKIMVLQAEIDELDESIHKMELIRMTESSKFHIRTKLHEFQDKITRKAERDRQHNDDGDSSDGHTEASGDDDPSDSSSEVNENNADENDNDSNSSESNDGDDSDNDSDGDDHGDDDGDDEKENSRAYLMMATSSYESCPNYFCR